MGDFCKGNGRMVGRDDLAGSFQPCDSMWLSGFSLSELLAESVLAKRSREAAKVQHLSLKLWTSLGMAASNCNVLAA